MERLRDSIFEQEEPEKKEGLLKTELTKSLLNSPNSVQIIQLLTLSPESVDLSLMQMALSRVCYLQGNLEEIRDKQLEDFKEVKHVRILFFFLI
jgi:hypothetical protein